MRQTARILMAVTLMVIAPLAFGAYPVRGQAPLQTTPGPTPVATVVKKPSSTYIMDHMMRAWEAAASEHFLMTEHVIDVRGATKTIRSDSQAGDIAWEKNPPVFRMAGPTSMTRKTAKGTSTTRYTETQLSDQNLLAIKLGVHKWTCVHFFAYGSLPGSPVWDVTSPYGIDGRTMGQAAVNGVETWHVRAYRIVIGAKGSTRPASIAQLDYFASEVNFLPLKIHIGFRYSIKNRHGTQNTTLLMSDFGELVQVTLPPVCGHP